jgi:hypothetical protein
MWTEPASARGGVEPAFRAARFRAAFFLVAMSAPPLLASGHYARSYAVLATFGSGNVLPVHVRASSYMAPAYVTLEVEHAPAPGRLPELADMLDLLSVP